MASNSLPKGIDENYVLARAMAEGAKVHESSIGLRHNTESVIRAALATAQAAASAAFAAANTAKECAAAQLAADTEAKAFIGASRKVLSIHHGNRWSPAWKKIGFPANSTAIPTSLAERQSLLGALGEYLAANPEYANVQLGITAEHAAEVFDALATACAAANAGTSAASLADDAFEAAKRALRMRMSGLISELGQLIGAEDSRWYAFGLNRPADPAKPGVPENLTIRAAGTGSVYAAWSAAPRAARYRVYVKDSGETEFTARLSTAESNATVAGLTTGGSGGSVWIRVTAVNDGGESRPCKAVELVTAPGQILAGRAA